MAERVARDAEVTLSADLSHLSEGDRQAVGLLIDAGQIIDGLFWQQVWGDRQDLLARTNDPATARYIDINYGPWDLLMATSHLWTASGRVRPVPASTRPT